MDPVHNKVSGCNDVFLDRFVVQNVAIYANLLAINGFVTVDIPLALQGIVHDAPENILCITLNMTLGSDDEEASD